MQPKECRLEFKETMLSAKTIVAFINDADGDLFIGIKEIANEMKAYPQIELRGEEVRFSLQV